MGSILFSRDLTISLLGLSYLTLLTMGSNHFLVKMADVESKSILHEFPSSHWSKATGQCVLERYLSVTMMLHGHVTLMSS